MKLIRFLEGGVSIEYLDGLSYPKFSEMLKVAEKLSKKEEQYIKQGQR